MSLISELVKYSNKTYEKGLVSATDGNLSIRLDNSRIAITRSGINKGDVTEHDIIIVDNNGNKLEGKGKASSELKIHLLAYNNRADLKAVVHCHPIYATAFATSKLDFTQPVFPEVILTIGPVPLCKYGTPSTEELPNSMKPHIQHSWAMLLENHGAVTFGEDIASAYNRMEKLEHFAKTIFISELLGGKNILSDHEVEKLYSIAENTYGIKSLSKHNNSEGKSYTNMDLNSLTNNEISFSDIIDARLRARAGNQVFNKYNKLINSKTKNKS
jgi:L-fuculose-phosphate aldolase